MDQSLSRLPLVFSRHRWSALAAFSAVMCGLCLYVVFAPRLYTSKVRLILDGTPSTSVSDFGSTIAQQPGNGALANQEEIVSSKRLLERALQSYRQQWDDPVDIPLSVGELKQSLQTGIVPGTDIFQLQYTSSDPELASRMLNSIAQTVVQENTETIQAEAKSAREFLEGQIPQRRQELLQVEARMSKFKQEYGYVTLSAEGNNNEANQLLVNSYAQLEGQIRDLTSQIQEVDARNLSLSTLTNAGSINNTYTSVRTGQDPELQNLKSAVTNLESQVAARRTELTDSHPIVIQLVQELDAARTLYNQRLSQLGGGSSVNIAPESARVGQDLSVQLIQGKIERLSLQERLEAARGSMKQLESRRQQFPILEQWFTQMDRRREALFNSIQLLERKLDEVRVAEAQLLSNFRILDLSEPSGKPSDPNIPVVLILGTLAGAVLSIGTVILLEALNRKLYSADEIEELVELPVLSTLPRLSKNTLNLGEPASFYENSAILEAYRALFKALEFRGLEEFHTLVVSSAISGEGKSVVTSYLAAVAAMLSRRTLIIDADLRRPTIHKQFQLPNKSGLSDILSGDVSLESAAQSTSIDNLSVVTAGSSCVLPSRFFESDGMKILLEEARSSYDLVIVDTPPVTSCVDAMAVSSEGYPLLLIARPNVTEKDLLKRSAAELIEHNINVLGVAVNDGIPKTDRYYQYRLESYQETA
ncbi:Tyrosine-protein kinase ptk [Acaryochloris thomasi RCC1774]|uniref:non-specific protein-tyrosine kinase n=1 Tax=Acaryochloris thomasi RCC1774 TaxID=1764569 RepID=A0A2W1JIN9_9CYAN|nr:tyrosine-protein kinase family protein [Acaryochloris thomasi]PZD73156.1 Tyrosine-protein kinase ptk [Acaryochloris thomasi RCC1774]